MHAANNGNLKNSQCGKEDTQLTSPTMAPKMAPKMAPATGAPRKTSWPTAAPRMAKQSVSSCLATSRTTPAPTRARLWCRLRRMNLQQSRGKMHKAAAMQRKADKHAATQRITA